MSELFDGAVKVVKEGKFEISDVDKLKLYAYYKIATNNLIANQTAPIAIDLVGMTKWNARKAAEMECKNKDDAMNKYVELVVSSLV
tara:strand:+ start:1070 stop:1327 length:258 start_codon:yes stop_codon:yes gene_type:complete